MVFGSVGFLLLKYKRAVLYRGAPRFSISIYSIYLAHAGAACRKALAKVRGSLATKLKVNCAPGWPPHTGQASATPWTRYKVVRLYRRV